jgi:transposase
MMSVEELRKQFPVRQVTFYGECIVVPGTKFDPDWEAVLGDAGYNCINTDFEGKAVTLVRLRKPNAAGELPATKTVFEAPAPSQSNNVTKLQSDHKITTEPPREQAGIQREFKGKKRPSGPDWTLEENEKLIALWSQTPKLKKRVIAASFPGRTEVAVVQRLNRLRKKGTIKGRWVKGSKATKSTKLQSDHKTAIKSSRTGYAHKKKNPKEIIEFAVALSKSETPAYSTQDISNMILSKFGVKVSHVAVTNWLHQSQSTLTSTVEKTNKVTESTQEQAEPATPQLLVDKPAEKRQSSVPCISTTITVNVQVDTGNPAAVEGLIKLLKELSA